MPGDDWQKFANLRLLFGYMFGQPGKKLLFMGGEFGQWQRVEPRRAASTGTCSATRRTPACSSWVADLNRFYRGEPALHELDCDPAGFEWIDCNDAAASVISFLRKVARTDESMLVVCNFTPVPRTGYRVGVPHGGYWEEMLNSDADSTAAAAWGNQGGAWADPHGWHGTAVLVAPDDSAARGAVLEDMNTPEVVVIGAGAAGLMASIRAAVRQPRAVARKEPQAGRENPDVRRDWRCNITHACDNRGIVDAFGPNGKFLHSALACLTVQQTIQFFEDLGVATKAEDTGKIFPVSDKAIDVLHALLNRLKSSGAVLVLEEPVADLRLASTGGGFEVATSKWQVHVPRVILTTGGQSYPGCGTRGDGYAFVHKMGHSIVPPKPVRSHHGASRLERRIARCHVERRDRPGVPSS